MKLCQRAEFRLVKICGICPHLHSPLFTDIRMHTMMHMCVCVCVYITKPKGKIKGAVAAQSHDLIPLLLSTLLISSSKVIAS